MKKFLSGLLLISSIASANTCRDVYASKKWISPLKIDQLGDVAESTAAMGGVVGTMVSLSAMSSATYPGVVVAVGMVGGAAAGPIIFLSALGISTSVVAIHDSKFNKVIKLIDQANKHHLYATKPGKLLKKLHKKISQESEISIEDLSETIFRKNLDLSLCSDEKELSSFKKLAKEISVTNIEL